MKFFRKIRRNLLTEGNTGKYFKYAIGEIFLVVIGILIALSINNWNQNRKYQKELNNIYQMITIDIENDILELSSHIEFYNDLEPVFNKVINDSVTFELLDYGLSRLTDASPSTNLNKSGLNRLKSLSVKDSLSLKIIEIYDLMENVRILPNEKTITDEGWVIADNIMSKYDWYPEWMSKVITKDNSSMELQDYFVNNKEYRHFVVSQHHKIYRNYLPVIEISINELKNINKELQSIIDR